MGHCSKNIVYGMSFRGIHETSFPGYHLWYVIYGISFLEYLPQGILWDNELGIFCAVHCDIIPHQSNPDVF